MIRFYGVATISGLLKIIGLLIKRALSKGRYYPKETYYFKEPTNRSLPICDQQIESRHQVFLCDMTHCISDMTQFILDLTHS